MINTRYILFGMGLIILCFSSCKSSEPGALGEKPDSLGKSKDFIGIGLIHVNVQHNLPLYASFEDKVPYDHIRFIKQQSGFDKGIVIFKTNFLKDKLIPYAMEQGDSDQAAQNHINMGLIRFSPLLTFRYIEQQGHDFKVLLNEKTGETSVLRFDPKNNISKEIQESQQNFDPHLFSPQVSNWYFPETWKNALLRAYSINYPQETIQYDSPEGKPIKAMDYLYRVDSVAGSWIKVAQPYINSSNDPKPSAWIKWKNDSQMLISVQLHGGYD